VALLEHRSLPDVQASGDDRDVALDAVGVSGFSFPIQVLGPDGSSESSIADAEMTVALPADMKGTHMSRFIEEAAAIPRVTPRVVLDLSRLLLERLDAPASSVELRFPLFVDRPAPMTGLSAPHRYDVHLRAVVSADEEVVSIGVAAPVTSLCPCSREISDYGAHSQRGIVELAVETPGWSDGEGIWPQELFSYADEAGSAPIYPLLKRPDERSVTMQAYDAPAFVEDIARNVVVAVRADERCVSWTVLVSNQESIHAHQAIARVSGRR
jgi:GTP cyclohydrolase I